MTGHFTAVSSDYLAPFNNSFELARCPHEADIDLTPRKAKKKLPGIVNDISDMQRRLYAQNDHALLLVFQAMDAAGKDSTIRATLSGVNPAGCNVTSFKRLSDVELDHDFLWRSACALPERGRIGVFNRSYYEEVLVVRVHPGILDNQQLPYRPEPETLWAQRLESIREHEKHLARNGTTIVKFFLNISREEQRRRFMARLEQPHKRWKFEPGDVRERGYWDDYMHAYEQAIRETSRPWAPWYTIPADNKPLMRYLVADIIRRSLSSLDLKYPVTGAGDQAIHDEMYAQLQAET